MPLPKTEKPIYTLELPVSKNKIKFTPFTVKEKKLLQIALESEDKETIEDAIHQVLNNCLLTQLEINDLPIVDVEFFFLNIRARSVGEIVETRYRCENLVGDKTCNNVMETSFDILDIKVDVNPNNKDVIELGNNMTLKLRYPQFSIVKTASEEVSEADVAYQMITNSIEWIYDGEQYYYAKESTKEELDEFIESLTQQQFMKIESFFETLPVLKKIVNVKCKKCGFDHEIVVQGLASFFE